MNNHVGFKVKKQKRKRKKQRMRSHNFAELDMIWWHPIIYCLVQRLAVCWILLLLSCGPGRSSYLMNACIYQDTQCFPKCFRKLFNLLMQATISLLALSYKTFHWLQSELAAHQRVIRVVVFTVTQQHELTR